MQIIHSKKAKGLCVAYRCTRKHTPKDRFCAKHSKRHQKESNHVSYCYANLRQNAKRRGKQFDLTIEEFRCFCEKTKYLERKGKSGKSASIDRVDPAKGYSIDNIQVLSLAENSRKAMQERYQEDTPF